MKSLRSKLTTGLLLSLLIIFSVLWLLVSSTIQWLAEDYIASRLSHDNETLLSAISFNSDNKLQLDSDRIDSIYSRPFSGHYFSVRHNNEHLRSRSLWDQQLPILSTNIGQHQIDIIPGPQDQSLLIISQSYQKQGQTISIAVAEDLSPLHRDIRHFQIRFAVVTVGMLILLIIVQLYILKSSLKPLRELQQDLRQLEQGNINKLDKPVPTELTPLVDEINHLLSIMQQRLQRSRNALGDLAHAIKKPLTVIQQLANHDHSEHSETLQQQSQDIQQLTQHILKRAQLAGQGPVLATFRFDKDLPALINTLTTMYAQKKISIQPTINNAIDCNIDREDMLELLGNLLDNACKWAKQQVSITVSQNTRLNISIEDDGPGVAAEKITLLAQRGVRLDEAIDGHGLGLAIAADIINNYNGTFEFSKSDQLGGFKVNVQIPLTKKPA